MNLEDLDGQLLKLKACCQHLLNSVLTNKQLPYSAAEYWVNNDSKR